MDKKFALQKKKFWNRFIFWLLGIPLNFVPIVFKHLSNITADNFPGIQNLLLMAIGDFDLSFISISVVFILCIEGFFSENELAPIYRRFQLNSVATAFLVSSISD